LTQVFLNLLLNAADATGGEGRIVIDARVADRQVVVGFEDDGAGVAPEHRARLFEPFFTTRMSAKAPASGSRIAGDRRALGRSIRFEEPPSGKGARFAVYLAVASANRVT